MKKISTSILVVFLLILKASPQPGSVDPTFGNNGIVPSSFDGFISLVKLPDGKVVALEKYALRRFHLDGSLDIDFGLMGSIYYSLQFAPNAMAIQSDGKIVVSGPIGWGPGGRSMFAIARFNTNGNLDENFGINGLTVTGFQDVESSSPSSLAIQSDGKIIVSGVAGNSLYPYGTNIAIARFSPDGSLDPNFDNDGRLTSELTFSQPNSMVIQPDGKLLVASGVLVNDDVKLAVIRYHPDGSLDATFDGDGKMISDLNYVYAGNSIALQSDGKIIAGGKALIEYNFSSIDVAACSRYNADGSIDVGFGLNGKVTFPAIWNPGTVCLSVQYDEKIILGASIDDFNTNVIQMAFARFNNDGSFDNGFGTNGSVILENHFFSSIVVDDENNRIYTVGPDAIRAFQINQEEICDGLDNDGDGLIDDADPSVIGPRKWYPDIDGDLYGDNSVEPTLSCAILPGFVRNNSDCDDNNAAINLSSQEFCNGVDDDCDGLVDEADPSVYLDNWFLDNDNDGFGDINVEPIRSCTRPPGYIKDNNQDCDDNNASIYWLAPELCDGIDNDCDGRIDEDFDADGDTYTTCGDITNKRTNGLPGGKDCDDNNFYLTGVEICDGLDNDCDGLIDEDLEIKTYYLDVDGDGYGVVDFTVTSCIRPFGYAPWSGDCNDFDPNTHPGGEFGCDIIRRYYPDKDGDGFGVDDDYINSYALQPPSGYAPRSGDCNDNHAGISPAVVWCKDEDNDGYGDGTILMQCEQPAGFKAATCLIATRGDCDDNNSSIHPSSTEICGNGIDDDCNQLTTDACPIADNDNDGDPDVTDCDDNNPNIHHEAIEVCNGIDDNCNGLIDENTSIGATITPSGTQTLCNGKTLTLFASPALAGNTYVWYKNNKLISNETSSTLIVNSGGDYKVKITQNNCSATSAVTTVSLITSPTASIKISGKNSNPCSGSVQLVANSVQGTYEWYKDGIRQNSVGSSFSATTAGEYWVIITKNGCSTESNHITLSCPSTRVKSNEPMNEITNVKSDLQVHPNPATHFLDVQWTTTNTSQSTIRILNAEGKVVKTLTTKGTVNNQRISLNGLAKGMYILVLKIGSDQRVSKFVIR